MRGNENNAAAAKQRARDLEHELRLNLYARYPLELIERRMDRPPENPEDRKGWRPIEEGSQRVYHCYLRYSWCFPICYQYAVLMRDSEIVYDTDGQPVPLTETRVAEILGVPQQRVAEWRARLTARKLLRVEGLRVYPLHKPAALSRAERASYTCI